MEKCNRCKLWYPDGYTSPVIGILGINCGGVCGICALDITNEILGVEREKFNGEQAENMRQNAILWRKTSIDPSADLKKNETK
jgi:hypothetical protein